MPMPRYVESLRSMGVEPSPGLVLKYKDEACKQATDGRFGYDPVSGTCSRPLSGEELRGFVPYAEARARAGVPVSGFGEMRYKEAMCREATDGRYGYDPVTGTCTYSPDVKYSTCSLDER